MVLLVTGGRDFADSILVSTVMESAVSKLSVERVMHGAAKGLDSLVHKWCLDHGIKTWPVPAWWSQYQNSAGPIRNGVMVDILSFTFGVDGFALLRFPGGNGTRDCAQQCERLGVKVYDAAKIYDNLQQKRTSED